MIQGGSPCFIQAYAEDFLIRFHFLQTMRKEIPLFAPGPNILKVSVIIPVLNLEQFIARAVRSVLIQDEVIECLIIDDGSTDNTRKICEELAGEDNRVRVLSHEGGANLGTSASRNLGLKMAKGSYVSFLDGDDYYLPNRFEKAREAFQINPLIDGVYDAMVSEPDLDSPAPKLTTMTEEIVPEELFAKMAPFGRSGHFSICTITLKKEVALGVDFFNESISIVEDSLWIAKLVLDYILVPGQIKKPLVVRGIHTNNISKNTSQLRNQRVKMCFDLLDWANQIGKSPKVKEIITNLLLKYHYEQNQLFSNESKWAKKLADLRFLARLYRIDPSTFKYIRVVYFRNLVFGMVRGEHINFYK